MVIPGTSVVIPGTLVVIPGTLVVIPGTLVVIPGLTRNLIFKKSVSLLFDPFCNKFVLTAI